MIEHLRAPDRITYPVKSTRMIGDELWIQLDTTIRDEVPMSRWFKAFDLAGLWQVNHPAIDRLRGVTPPFETDMVFTCAEPPRALAIWRPTIEVPITQLGYYREGSRQPAIPGVNLTMCNVRIVLTLPVAA